MFISVNYTSGIKEDMLLNLDNVIAFYDNGYNRTQVITARQEDSSRINSNNLSLMTPFSEIKKLIEEASFKDYVNNMAKLAEAWPKDLTKLA